jgi:hypothetical protein
MNIEKRNKTIVDADTGEAIINTDEIKELYNKEALRLKAEQVEMGISSDIRIQKIRCRTYPIKSIKPKYEFIKCFRIELRELMQSKEISKNAKYFIGLLCPFIYFPINSILIDGQHPTKESLMELSELSIHPVQNALSELEKHEMVKRIRNGNTWTIYFNPFLICAGYGVDVETYNYFKHSIYNLENVQNLYTQNIESVHP